jgi:hypothetical protein
MLQFPVLSKFDFDFSTTNDAVNTGIIQEPMINELTTRGRSIFGYVEVKQIDQNLSTESGRSVTKEIMTTVKPAISVMVQTVLSGGRLFEAWKE